MNNGMYVPLSRLLSEKGISDWTFTELNLPYHDLVKRGIVMWCEKNLDGPWTMTGGSRFGFESPHDALIFKIHFGFSGDVNE